ncbi:MAG: hypothetical protein ACTSRK_20070, partial [Promethearchaeota archaeon]
MKKNTWKILLLGGILLAVGFSVSPIYIRLSAKNFDLETIPSTHSMDNTSVSISAHLWRDFMPSDSIGHPLMCAITLTSNISSDHSFDIFSNLIVNDFWAINGDAMWHRYLWSSLIPDSDYRITNT